MFLHLVFFQLVRASALSLTRSAQGKTSVSFAEQRRNEVATVFIAKMLRIYTVLRRIYTALRRIYTVPVYK